MRFLKSGLLTMLVSLFILSACNNPTSIGLDIDPDLDLNSTFVDTSTVNASLIKEDSSLANFVSNSVLSYFKDPIFGTTTSNIATALSVPSTGFTFGKEPTLDSAVLILPYISFYGDSANTNYQVEVRQLDEVLYNESNKSYYTNKKWAVKSTVIATKNFFPKYRDSIIIQDIVAGKKDTVKKVIPQLRITLSPSFVLNNIINLDSAIRSTNTSFNNYIKGLYISLNKNNTTNRGGIFSFDTYTNGGAKLQIFYKNKKADGKADTLNTSFNINGASGQAVSEIEWELDGTPVKTALQTGDASKLYFAGLNRTMAKVSFPYVQKLKSLGKNIAINRAELILKIDPNSETTYKPIPQLKIFRWDIANRPQLMPDEDPRDPRYIGPNYIGGFYNSKSKSYVFNITGYIQDLMIGKTKEYGTFITSTNFNNNLSELSTIARSVTGGSPNATSQIKLKVYYTDLK